MTTIEVLPLSELSSDAPSIVSETPLSSVVSENNADNANNDQTMPRNDEIMPDNGSNNSDNASNNADNAAAKKRGRPFGAKDGAKRKPYVRQPRAPPVSASETIAETPVSRQTKQTIQTIPETMETIPRTKETIPRTTASSSVSPNVAPIVSPSVPDPRELIYQYHTKKKEREEAQWATHISSMLVRPVR